MLNSMKGIDPKYEPDNIPPCPKKETTGMVVKGVWKEEVLNQKKIDLWHELFGNKTSPVKLYKQIK